MSENRNVRRESKSRFIWKVAVLVVAALILIYSSQIFAVLSRVVSAFMPFFIGFSIFYIWSLIVNPLEKFLFSKLEGSKISKFKRPITIILSLIILIGIIVLLMNIVLPQLFDSFRVLASSLPKVAQDFRIWLLEVTENVNWLQDSRQQLETMDVNWQQLLQQAAENFEGSFAGILGSTFSFATSIIGAFVTVLTSFIFALYFLAGKEKLGRGVNSVLKAYTKPRTQEKFYYVTGVVSNTFSAFFRGQVIDAFLVGVLLFIAMTIAQLPYALSISVVVMVTALIPMVGAFIGGAVGFIMIAANSFQQGAIFLIVLVFIQQLEGDLIYPRVVGNSIGLPGIWVFLSIIVAGSLFGPLGMLLAVPITASAYKLLRNDINSRISEAEKRNLEDEIELRDLNDKEEVVE